jgi:hypothetical protein
MTTRARKLRKSKMISPADSALVERQSKCFDLSIQGFTNTSIGRLVAIDRGTVARDVRAEADRRAKEYAHDRNSSVARSVAFYERVISDSVLRMQEFRTVIATSKHWHEQIAYRHLARLEFLHS